MSVFSVLFRASLMYYYYRFIVHSDRVGLPLHNILSISFCHGFVSKKIFHCLFYMFDYCIDVQVTIIKSLK